ncbi:hypothetical protein H0N95_00745 [Candidatus Micrarchaeota archaeon]|nr:hypothetical protein [Candidatus Micrarchaeota archaeon]
MVMIKKRGFVIVSPEEIGKRRSIPEFIADKPKIMEFHKKRIELAKAIVEHEKKTGKIVFKSKSEIHSVRWNPQYASASERFSVIRTLVDNGYEVRVLSPKDPALKKRFEKFIGKATEFGAKELETEEKDPRLLSYVRDSETKIGKTVFVSPEATDDILKRTGNTSQRVISRAGEGGKIVDGGKFAIASGDMTEKEIQQVEKETGKKVYKIPTAIEPVELKLWPKQTIATYLAEMLHVDMYVNVIPQRNIMLVEDAYLRQNKKQIEAIAKKEGLKIVATDPKEFRMRPTNFLRLPDGKMLFNKAPKTIEKLKKAGVKDEDFIVNERKVEFNPEYGGGSIRCFTLSSR